LFFNPDLLGDCVGFIAAAVSGGLANFQFLQVAKIVLKFQPERGFLHFST
jgi:hypothetical protein